MTKKLLSTFERKMQNPKFKIMYEKSYRELLHSELRLAKKAGDRESIEGLTKELASMEKQS